MPQQIHFYWGGDTISYLRYMAVSSFRQLNPDWKIKLHFPKVRYRGPRTWYTQEHPGYFCGQDYSDQLWSLDVEKIQVDFDRMGFANNVPETFKADFLRWGLLAQDGGLWSDMDILYFRPMEKVYFNRVSLKNCDTFVCIKENGYNYHSIGFLLSSPENEFFGSIHQKSLTRFQPQSYQSIGSLLLNADFPTISAINAEFAGVFPHNMKMETVYPLHEPNIGCIFESPDTHLFGNETIGIHWYAGHPVSGQWENILTEDNFSQYDNIICKILPWITRRV